jgi:hypothetical protein
VLKFVRALQSFVRIGQSGPLHRNICVRFGASGACLANYWSEQDFFRAQAVRRTERLLYVQDYWMSRFRASRRKLKVSSPHPRMREETSSFRDVFVLNTRRCAEFRSRDNARSSERRRHAARPIHLPSVPTVFKMSHDQ